MLCINAIYARRVLDVACTFSMVEPEYAKELANAVMASTFARNEYMDVFDAAAALKAVL